MGRTFGEVLPRQTAIRILEEAPKDETKKDGDSAAYWRSAHIKGKMLISISLEGELYKKLLTLAKFMHSTTDFDEFVSLVFDVGLDEIALDVANVVLNGEGGEFFFKKKEDKK